MSWLVLLPTMVIVLILGGIGGAFLIAAGYSQTEAAWFVVLAAIVGFFWNIGLLEGDPTSKKDPPKRKDLYEIPPSVSLFSKAKRFPANAWKGFKGAIVAPFVFVPWFFKTAWQGIRALLALVGFLLLAVGGVLLFVVGLSAVGIALYWVLMQWIG